MKNVCIAGVGFVLRDDGLSLREMVAKLHEHGYLTAEEMAEDGGATALQRKMYDGLFQNRHHYSNHRKPYSELTEEEKEKQAREQKLAREMNAYADALGVNDPKYMDMITTPEDLEAFGIEVNGKNIVDAELVAKSIHNDPLAIEKLKAPPSQTMVCILEMVRWVLAGRPDDRRGGS